MIQLENIKSSGHFTEVSLQKWDILFHEWDINKNIYIVYDGELCVQKSIATKRGEFKTLGLLGIGNIVGEWSLSNNDQKQVQIIANRNTTLLAIEWKKDFPNFVNAFPRDGYTLLTTIIDIANTRLLRANKELTANYEVNIAISKIKDISMSSIYKLLLIFESILWVDQIMYFEKNIVMDEYYKLRYNSKSKHSLQNKIIKFPGEILDFQKLSEENIETAKYYRYTKLSLWEENHWFIVVWRDSKDFHENEEQLLQNTAWSFVGVIHQKKIMDDDRNKNYIKSAL